MAVGETARLLVALELKDKFSGQLFKATAALSDAERKLGGLQRSSLIAGRGIGAAANNIKLIGLASVATIGGLGIKAIDAAVDFEDAFAGIRKTVSEVDLAAAGLTFEDISDSIRKMAREIPVAATELAAIGEAAGALGIKAADIEEFTRVVAELSVTTDLTSETAATALGQLGTILNLTGDEFRDFSDSLVALGNNGASTESQIIDIAARFAAAGVSAGLSKEDILALASATASMGIDAESAGSSLSRVFNGVAVNIGTSSKKADEFAEALGLSAAEFKKAWAEDAVGTFEDFLEKLNTLDQFEAADLLKKVGITGVRDINAVRLMAQNIDDVNAALAVSENATDALGIEARKKFDTTASQLKILKNNFTDVGITIGSAVLPKITEMTGKLVEFLNTPKAQGVIEDIAAALPGGIDKLVALGQTIPWGIIGDSFKIVGTASQMLLDAFLDMPEWVQTAVITGWGLNKLTGGALGGIVGELGKGLIKGILGMNAGVVNINAGVVNGPGGVGGPGGGGKAPLLPLLGAAAVAATVPFISGSNVNTSTEVAMLDQAAHKFGATVDSVLATGATLGAIKAFTDDPALRAGVPPEILTALDELANQTSTLNPVLKDIYSTNEESRRLNQQIKDEITAEANKRSAAAASTLDTLRGQANTLTRIEAKPTRVNVRVSQTVNVTNSATQMVQSIKRLVDTGDAFVGSM